MHTYGEKGTLGLAVGHLLGTGTSSIPTVPVSRSRNRRVRPRGEVSSLVNIFGGGQHLTQHCYPGRRDKGSQLCGRVGTSGQSGRSGRLADRLGHFGHLFPREIPNRGVSFYIPHPPPPPPFTRPRVRGTCRATAAATGCPQSRGLCGTATPCTAGSCR